MIISTPAWWRKTRRLAGRGEEKRALQVSVSRCRAAAFSVIERVGEIQMPGVEEARGRSRRQKYRRLAISNAGGGMAHRRRRRVITFVAAGSNNALPSSPHHLRLIPPFYLTLVPGTRSILIVGGVFLSCIQSVTVNNYFKTCWRVSNCDCAIQYPKIWIINVFYENS